MKRFPSDFMFALTKEEFARLRSQSVISKSGRGGGRYPPLAFAEHGIAMLSSVLRSERAVQVNIAIMRAFAHFRQMLLGHKELAEKLVSLERKYDRQFKVVFDAIRELLEPPRRSRRVIGFRR